MLLQEHPPSWGPQVYSVSGGDEILCGSYAETARAVKSHPVGFESLLSVGKQSVLVIPPKRHIEAKSKGPSAPGLAIKNLNGPQLPTPTPTHRVEVPGFAAVGEERGNGFCQLEGH